MKVIILASGDLGFNTFLKLRNISISHIFTDKKSEKIISFAKENNIEYTTGDPKKLDNFDFLIEKSDSWIVSINYIFIIPVGMINVVNGKAINIHGSLLPKYRGRTPHVWAIINGELETGITVHYITAGCDEGDILAQKKIEILNKDSGGSILEKFKTEYPIIISQVLENIEKGTLEPMPQNVSEATYFPKRNPEDGKINWNWQKDRIRNWIRAQTDPYPGAFTEYEGHRVKVWSCTFSNEEYDVSQQNGTVIKIENGNVYVKSTDGVICLDDSDFNGGIKKGQVLSN